MLIALILVILIASIYTPWRNVLYYMVVLFGAGVCFLQQFAKVPPHLNIMVWLWCLSAFFMLLDIRARHIQKRKEYEQAFMSHPGRPGK